MIEWCFAPLLVKMSPAEMVASVLGLVSVYLTVRQNVWCWPLGAVMVALYAVIFWMVNLFADAGLQVFFFGMQFYGWYEWLHGGEGRAELPVRLTPRPLLAPLALLGIACTAALGYTLRRWTRQDLAYWDSGIVVFSLIAQWMLARKYLENWLVWIGVDVVAVGVYWVKDLHATAVLYVVFLLLCVAGLRDWRRSLAAQAPQPGTVKTEWPGWKA
jgi:nicotinamide mononucleotide transporter